MSFSVNIGLQRTTWWGEDRRSSAAQVYCTINSRGVFVKVFGNAVVPQFEIAGDGGESRSVAAWILAKRPLDLNQLARMIVDIATGEAEDIVSEARA